MKTVLCCLYNKTTGHHSVPLVFETKEQAVTNFISEIQAPNSELANIKDTLSIYAIGTYEHTTGSISSHLKKKLLLHGKEVNLPPQKPELSSKNPADWQNNINSQKENV